MPGTTNLVLCPTPGYKFNRQTQEPSAIYSESVMTKSLIKMLHDYQQKTQL